MKIFCIPLIYNLIYRSRCKEFSAGLKTAMDYIKEVASKIEPDANDKQAKSWIISKIDQFMERRIVGAIEVITEKVMDGLF